MFVDLRRSGDLSQQVKSKERVQEHGEVFTNEREVNAMLDLVKPETERIDSRFLEPACGDGNFLAEVLRRKLAVVAKRYSRSHQEYMRYAFVAVSSIYGVDIMPDNVAECRQRLLLIIESAARDTIGKRVEKAFLDAVRYVLEKNVLCGDALTMVRNDGSPIVFAEWSMVTGDLVKRKDYRLDELMAGGDTKQGDQLGLFQTGWEYDSEIDGLIPSSIREYPPVDYREVSKNG